jgi:cystathionine beta-lyase/cystathionine gamma-synthase
MKSCLKQEEEQPFYTRGVNPTTRILCKKMAALEGMDQALAFGSGSAAIAAAVMSQVKAGDHAICVENPYSWTNKLFREYLSKYGVTSTFVNGKNPENFKNAIKSNTKLIFLESPNSFWFDMQDLEEVSKIAKKNNIKLVLDNSYASPLNQNGSKYGIDIIVHSATKYIGGHSDVVGGILCCSNEGYQKMFKNEFMTLGAIMSPWNAWLMIRSLRTLELRMERTSNSSAEVVEYLEDHPAIQKVYHPGSKTYDQNELFNKYLKQPSGLFTIKLKTDDLNKIESFCNSLKKFKLACSWGSFESLVFPAMATYQGKEKPKDQLNMIRIAIGLEDPKVLIQDLGQALDF